MNLDLKFYNRVLSFSFSEKEKNASLIIFMQQKWLITPK